jgi:hypothetical protein
MQIITLILRVFSWLTVISPKDNIISDQIERFPLNFMNKRHISQTKQSLLSKFKHKIKTVILKI